MSFDLVPADLVLEIFHQLPFKDRVRLGGVNRLFNDVSVESISKMKSLVVNKDLETYSVWVQKFSSLLESCSPTLESIDVSSKSCPKSFLSAVTEFCYPKLKRLEILITDGNIGQMNVLISRKPNLRSIIVHLNYVHLSRLHNGMTQCGYYEWPDDIDWEKMEKLEIIVCNNFIHFSPTLRPLIGKLPNLKRLTIKSEVGPSRELNQLLASSPSLEELYLDLAQHDIYHFTAAVPTWHLPKVTKLHIDTRYGDRNWSTISRFLPALFPRLESFTSTTIQKITIQDITALSQSIHLEKLRLPHLETTKEELSDLINPLTSITFLEIGKISDAHSSETFIDFLMFTIPIFHRRLQVRITERRAPLRARVAV